MTPDPQLQLHLWSTPFSDIESVWDQMTHKDTDTAAQRILCQTDLFYLLVRVMGRKDLLHPWLYDRCREVERAPDGHLDLWARDHRKSTIITRGLTVQEILQNPNITFIIFSNTMTIAKGFLAFIRRELETNQLLQSLFPDILYADPLRESPQWNTEGIIVRRTVNRTEPTVEAMGLMTGTKIGRHADRLIFDDIVVPESVTTAEQIERTTDAFVTALSLGTADAKHRLIGTRYKFNDTYSYLLDQKSYVPRVYPATVDGLVSGSPVFFTAAQWQKVLTTRNKKVIAEQYLLDPQSIQNRTFKLEDLNWWDVRPFAMNVYILADPARSKSEAACDTAMIVVGVQKNGLFFVLDGYCHRMSLVERWESLKTLYKRWSKTPGVQRCIVGYESVGNDDIEYFRQEMKSGFDPSGIFAIEAIDQRVTGGNPKHTRIERLEPDVRGHRVFLPYDNQQNATNPGHPTKAQVAIIKSGDLSRVSKPIRNVTKEGDEYNFIDILLKQLSEFPFSTKVDVLDALSRLYDMGVRKPIDLRDKFGAQVIQHVPKYQNLARKRRDPIQVH